MEYIDGGKTAYIYGSAGSIRTRLNTIIAASAIGNIAAAALGALISGPGGAVVGAFAGTLWFGRIFGYASQAHEQVESIIEKYGSSRSVCMKSTWSWGFCTSIKVSVD